MAESRNQFGVFKTVTISRSVTPPNLLILLRSSAFRQCCQNCAKFSARSLTMLMEGNADARTVEVSVVNFVREQANE
jgi:hypothetical protein